MPSVLKKARRGFEEPLEHEISPEVQEQLLEHPGKWAAITPDRLIAVGETPLEVYEKAIAEGVESPILFQVPIDSQTVYFL